MHGTTMVFLVGIPFVFGFGNYLVPLMIGAHGLAFPRLNAAAVGAGAPLAHHDGDRRANLKPSWTGPAERQQMPIHGATPWPSKLGIPPLTVGTPLAEV
jgi:Cytochrome C and Quinol oxidase polypeptide I